MKLAASPVYLNLNLKLNETSPTELSSQALRMNTAQNFQLKKINKIVSKKLLKTQPKKAHLRLLHAMLY